MVCDLGTDAGRAALLGRFGGTDLSRNTLAASVVRVGQAVQPVVNLLRDALLDSSIVHGDETEVQVLKEPGRKAQAKSYMWVQMTEASGPEGTGPPIRLFGYAPSRSTQTARALYEGMRAGGVLMSDGYEPYAAIAEQHRLVHLGCWAHYPERRFVRSCSGEHQVRRGRLLCRSPHKVQPIRATARTRASRPWASTPSSRPALCQPSSRTPAWRRASSAGWS